MKTMTGMSYSVSGPTRLCAHTGREIATGEEFVAALVQSEETGELSRLDFCLDACTNEARTDSGDGVKRRARPPRPPRIESPLMLLGSWRARMPAAGFKPRLLLDDASMLDLFEQTVELLEGGAGDPSVAALVASEAEGEVGSEVSEAASVNGATPEREAFAFVLALILVRKRLLFVEKSDRDTMTVRPREPKGTPESERAPAVVLRDPHMSEELIAQVAGQLETMLNDGAGAAPRTPAGSIRGGGAVSENGV